MTNFTELFGRSFDEASFALITSMKRLQKSPQYVTDRRQLETLLTKAEATPQELFAAPPPPKVKEREVAVPWQLRPLGRQYRMKHLTFASAHPSGQPNNDTVHGYYLYREGNEHGPTLFYLHGWMAYSVALWLRPPLGWAEPLGLNVFFLEQPYHMHRCPPGTQSGQLSLSGDLLMGMVTIQQSVSDVRSALHWLRHKQHVKQVGLLGRSMGGLVAATTLAAESGFDCAILDIPAVSPHSAIWRSSYTRLVRAELEQQGFDEQETAEFFEVIRPGRFRPALDPKRILLIEATADRACFPDETERFAQEWGVNLVRVPFGHMSIMFSRQAKRAAMSFLQHWLNRRHQ